MTRENIKTIIQDLFKQNLNAYPQDYPQTSDGSYTDLAMLNAVQTAWNYYDNRTEEETERDEAAEVYRLDYSNWCLEVLGIANYYLIAWDSDGKGIRSNGRGKRHARTNYVLERIKDGYDVALHDLTKERLIELGWSMEEGTAKDFLLTMRNDEIVLLAEDDHGNLFFVADTFEKMGGIEGLSELIENSTPHISDWMEERGIIPPGHHTGRINKATNANYLHEKLKEGYDVYLLDLTKERLIELGWKLEEGTAKYFMLMQRGDNITLMAEDDYGNLFSVAENFDRDRLLELIDNSNPQTSDHIIEPEDAERLEQAWTTQLCVNGKLTTLYDFLEENWGDGLTEKDVRQLFSLKTGEGCNIHQWDIKVL